MMKIKNPRFRRILFIISISLIGFSSLALTKSELFRQIAKSQKLIHNVIKYLVSNYADEIDIEAFTRSSIRNMVKEMDPYTVFLEEEERSGLDLLTKGKYGGVGIQIGRREGKLTVIAPMDDTPAKRAGIISGDIIVKIDSVVTKDLSLNEAAKMIRGDRGTKVILTIKRFGHDEALDFALIRDNIKVKDVAYSGMLDERVGYIRLTRFSRNSTPEMREALQGLTDQDAEAIVLDLRDNPGGLLQSAIEILDMFIPKGQKLLSTKGRTKESNRTFLSRKEPLIPEEVKLAVLINEGSASASEIVSGAIQDLDRGVVIGRRSFGKGLVQSVYTLDAKRSLKITTAKYYIPSGRLIQKPGYIDEDLIVNGSKEDSLFSTIGGRVVKGGGGIMPDHEIKITNPGLLTRECWRKGLFFSYVQKHKQDYDSFQDVLSNSDLMNDFHAYLNEIDFEISLTGENQIMEAKLKLIALDSTDLDLKSAFETIDSFITAEKATLFDKEKDDLELRLLAEFANQFNGKEGRFQYTLKQDEIVNKALSILEDQVAYREVFTTND